MEKRRPMRRRTTLIVAGVVALAAFALGGAAIAAGTEGDEADDEQALSGRIAERAQAAALKETGGGAVIEMERDMEEGRTYQVEIRKADGSTVDVDLDSSFRVVGIDVDGPEGLDDQDSDEPDERNEGADSDD
jgi:uncharacterized membrane protein YkoI